MAAPPPPGVYVPIVVFFDDNEDLDVRAIEYHVLRLAEVRGMLPRFSPL